MEWYGPITVLPALGLLILSTSNFIIALNNEIDKLKHDKDKYGGIINLKIHQLIRLGMAESTLYAGSLLFLIAGLFKATVISDDIFFSLMFGGAIATMIALGLLFIHSIKSIHIRQKHLKL
jgi:hypothetical protein